MKKTSGPQFLKYCIPIIEVLKDLGGSGKPAEVTDSVIEKLNISEEKQAETLKNGTSRVRNQIAWARFYLAKDGYLDSSLHGVWSLTDKGTKASLTQADVLSLFKNVQKRVSKKKEKDSSDQTAADESEDSIADQSDYKTELLELLRSISPAGFEKICQRLLRESGFQKVIVTGKSGDGGIDGHGILQINPLVSFKVLFQCKRYQGSVSSGTVRDFRGAMAGRADKGIIMTTGTFTTEAVKEAHRDGAVPLELVDGDKLIDMFEMVGLGLKPVRTFEIDYPFFEGFK